MVNNYLSKTFLRSYIKILWSQLLESEYVWTSLVPVTENWGENIEKEPFKDLILAWRILD